MLTKSKHLATVKALTNCQCFSLSWGDFQEALDGFPDVRRELETPERLHADGELP